ncbi:MAG TPA: hypothetical protein VGJ91_02845 [Polyangiaceae bacterium]|jgi:hypothetical protein
MFASASVKRHRLILQVEHANVPALDQRDPGLGLEHDAQQVAAVIFTGKAQAVCPRFWPRRAPRLERPVGEQRRKLCAFG